MKYFWATAFSIFLIGLLPTDAKTLLVDHSFQILKKKTVDPPSYVFELMEGDERANNSLNRLSIISQAQSSFADPESGCGPVAILNTVNWYEKYGLIRPKFSDASAEVRERKLFNFIDFRLLQEAGIHRRDLGGSRSYDIAITLDNIVSEQSGGRIRVHANILTPPFEVSDFLATMPNFRIGYLFGYPKNKETGEIESAHAMAVIRVDRAGYLTLATWGEKYRGLLRMRKGEQWFVPQNPEHTEFKLHSLIQFIPFKPKVQ